MKRMLKIGCLVSLLFCLSGCLNSDDLMNDNVYTTIYPIEFLTDYLYGTDKNVSSIYPPGADIESYQLTDKQKESYSKGALFIYNGITEEKQIAEEFRKENKDILFIDVSYKVKYDYAIEELWLRPNNYLMLARNIKENLLKYTKSKVVSESIETKFKELEETLSYMDADLRNIAKEASNVDKQTLIVSSDKLKFLSKYGFDVIVLGDKNTSEATLKANFKNNKYKNILYCNTDSETDLIKDLKTNYNANIINVDVMYTLSAEDELNRNNYITIMEEFIDNIRNTTR